MTFWSTGPSTPCRIQVKQLSLLFCAVERPGGEVVIPNGAFVPQAGDKLYLIGRPSSLDQFFRLLGRYSPKVKSVFIVGGGKISLYLSAVLEKMKMRVKIVEIQKDRCRFISERLPHTTVICGDGTDQELLESERMIRLGRLLRPSRTGTRTT